MLNQIIQGDCYELMKGIPDGSIDLVLTDPPYNTTACEWDKQPIDLTALWEILKLKLRNNAIVISTSAQPFTTDLINSNRKWFRYALVWEKNIATGFAKANVKPMAIHEDILIFAKGKITYNPQLQKGKPYIQKRKPITDFGEVLNSKTRRIDTVNTGFRYPTTIINLDREVGLHPTQKPIALFEYLIRTYSNPGETVLDPFAGSGTTAIAAHNTGRQFICFEKEQKYWQIANKRLELAQAQLRFDEMVG